MKFEHYVLLLWSMVRGKKKKSIHIYTHRYVSIYTYVYTVYIYTHIYTYIHTYINTSFNFIYGISYVHLIIIHFKIIFFSI